MADLVHNERVKYAATFFNNLGVLAFATGVVLPLFTQDLKIMESKNLLFGLGVFVGCFFMFAAQYLLKNLKE